jgi:hypothetical protein
VKIAFFQRSPPRRQTSSFFSLFLLPVTKLKLKTYTLRCNEIATIVFFQTFFRRFLGIIQVAHLALCYISKCLAGSLDFLQVNHFMGK